MRAYHRDEADNMVDFAVGDSGVTDIDLNYV
jgi:hypothetical protein